MHWRGFVCFERAARKCDRGSEALNAVRLDDQAAMFDLQKKDLLTLKDLSSERVKKDDDKGAVVSKERKILYPGQSVEDFRDMMKKGRLMLKVGNESENLDGDNVGKVFKWLGGTQGTKTLHNIYYTHIYIHK